MAKVQVAARFVTEVAPPQLVSVVQRRKVPRSLDTIVEDDREVPQLAYGDHQHQATASAASVKRALPAGARTGGAGFVRELSSARTGGAGFVRELSSARTGGAGFVRELSSCFSGNGVHGQAVGGGWESTRSKGHGRRAVLAQMHGN